MRPPAATPSSSPRRCWRGWSGCAADRTRRRARPRRRASRPRPGWCFRLVKLSCPRARSSTCWRAGWGRAPPRRPSPSAKERGLLVVDDGDVARFRHELARRAVGGGWIAGARRREMNPWLCSPACSGRGLWPTPHGSRTMHRRPAMPRPLRSSTCRRGLAGPWRSRSKPPRGGRRTTPRALRFAGRAGATGALAELLERLRRRVRAHRPGGRGARRRGASARAAGARVGDREREGAACWRAARWFLWWAGRSAEALESAGRGGGRAGGRPAPGPALRRRLHAPGQHPDAGPRHRRGDRGRAVAPSSSPSASASRDAAVRGRSNAVGSAQLALGRRPGAADCSDAASRSPGERGHDRAGGRRHDATSARAPARSGATPSPTAGCARPSRWSRGARPATPTGATSTGLAGPLRTSSRDAGPRRRTTAAEPGRAQAPGDAAEPHRGPHRARPAARPARRPGRRGRRSTRRWELAVAHRRPAADLARARPARAEAAWLDGEPAAVPGRGRRSPWSSPAGSATAWAIGELGVLAAAGRRPPRPARRRRPSPRRLQMAGRLAGGGRGAGGSSAAPTRRALALADSADRRATCSRRPRPAGTRSAPGRPRTPWPPPAGAGASGAVPARPRRATRANPAGLTARELEVLGAARRRASRNAEIAGRLHISDEDRRPPRLGDPGQARRAVTARRQPGGRGPRDPPPGRLLAGAVRPLAGRHLLAQAGQLVTVEDLLGLRERLPTPPPRHGGGRSPSGR